MPRPVGTDRLDVAEGGALVLLSWRPKGWRGRRSATATSPEHPGTAVLWEEELWEVVVAVVSMVSLLASVVGVGSLLPAWAAVPGVYFLAESGARISVAVTQGRPMGSLAGEAFGALLDFLRRRRG